MRLLVVGSDKKFRIENFYVKYLCEQGINVENFPAQDLFWEYCNAGFINRVLFRFKPALIYTSINRKFKLLVRNFEPDVILVFKGLEIYPESLIWAHSLGIKLVNYNPDNPFIFSGRGSGNINITKSIPLYDLHFTYNHSIQRQLKEKHNIQAVMLPFGFDIDDGVYDSVSKENEVKRTCFLGNPDSARSSFIKSLAEAGIQITVYGYDWAKYVKHSNIEIHAPVFEIELWKVLRKYRIQLNLMRSHNLDSHNMRTFEIPAIGGIMLAPDTPEHRSFFNDGEVFFFSDLESCISRISYLNGLPKSEVAKIRTAARERAITSGYAYRDRAQSMASAIRNIL